MQSEGGRRRGKRVQIAEGCEGQYRRDKTGGGAGSGRRGGRQGGGGGEKVRGAWGRWGRERRKKKTSLGSFECARGSGRPDAERVDSFFLAGCVYETAGAEGVGGGEGGGGAGRRAGARAQPRGHKRGRGGAGDAPRGRRRESLGKGAMAFVNSVQTTRRRQRTPRAPRDDLWRRADARAPPAGAGSPLDGSVGRQLAWRVPRQAAWWVPRRVPRQVPRRVPRRVPRWVAGRDARLCRGQGSPGKERGCARRVGPRRVGPPLPPSPPRFLSRLASVQGCPSGVPWVTWRVGCATSAASMSPLSQYEGVPFLMYQSIVLWSPSSQPTRSCHPSSMSFLSQIK